MTTRLRLRRSVVCTRTSRAGFAVAFAFCVALLGCSKKGASGSDAAAGGDSGAAVVTIANADDVTRYPNEKKIDNVTATVLRDDIAAHKSPPDGPEIAKLPKGTSVTKISQTADDVLVTFDDPKSGARMMGWVVEEAFTDAPAPVAHYAPKVAAADAGAAGAAGGASTAAPGAITAPPVNGKCGAGFVLIDSLCRKSCVTVADCPKSTFCVKKGSGKVCSISP